MDRSWESWDGSIISIRSIQSVDSSQSASSPPNARAFTARSLEDSDEERRPAQAAGGSDAELNRGTEGIHTFGDAQEPSTSPATDTISPHRGTPASTPIALPHAADAPAANEPEEPHPLASLLLAEHSLSPPASPTTSVSSFPGSRTRLSSAAGERASRSRPGRGRAHGRTGSASSTVSTDGSAHEEGGSSEDDQARLVMPSLHLGRPALSNSSGGEKEERPARQAKVLLLGRTADERRTLATLVAHDEDLQRVTSAASVAATTDMSFSFLSTKPPTRPAPRPQTPPVDSAGSFERISSSLDSPVVLYQTKDGVEGEHLLANLARPLERLEAKLNREYPSTTGICQLVESAGCGEFEACLYFFSAPPSASEIALARPISHLTPLIPVLILPRSPTGKPQRTTALSQAVQEQLDGAGVRWVPARPSPRGCASVGGSLYMLPSDLFSRQDVPHSPTTDDPAPGSSPTSEGGPPSTSSLSSSQELLPPSRLSSAPPSTSGDATGARSLAISAPSSTRSSKSVSSRSSSHRRYPSTSLFSTSDAMSSSLADLARLQHFLHAPSSPDYLRKERTRAFVEWREVEVAARGVAVRGIETLPTEWREEAARWTSGEESEGEGARGGKRTSLEFSKRVAVRRQALSKGSPVPTQGVEGSSNTSEDDGDILADSDDEDPHASPSIAERRDSTDTSFTNDPITPRCVQRELPVPLASMSTIVPGCETSPTGGDANEGYFPRYSSPSPARPRSVPHHDGDVDSSTSSLQSSTESTAASILVLPSSDPFHIPSLIHLVGLNLRLAVLAPALSPAVSSKSGSSVEAASEDEASSERDEPQAKRQAGRAGWGWLRTAASLSLVFAAGIAVGTQIAAAVDGGGSGGSGWVATTTLARRV